MLMHKLPIRKNAYYFLIKNMHALVLELKEWHKGKSN